MWWMGFAIGLILGIAALRQHNHKRFFSIIFNSIMITVFIAFATGLIGLSIGLFSFSDANLNWRFPANLLDLESFVALEFTHNFSYLAGLIGLIVALLFTRSMRKKYTAGADLI